MLGAELSYDANTRTVNMTRDGKTLSIRIDDQRLNVQNGLSAFDIRALAEWAPELHWNVDGDTVKLSLTASAG